MGYECIPGSTSRSLGSWLVHIPSLGPPFLGLSIHIRECHNGGKKHCTSIGFLLDPPTGPTLKNIITDVLISERAKRASSVMFVFNRDFRYV